MNELTINGKNSHSDFGLYVTSDTWLNGAQIQYSSYQVPKRMGDLMAWDGRFANILRTITLYHPEGEKMREDVEDFKRHVYSLPEGVETPYSKLETSYDLGFYALGTLVSFDVEPFKGKEGSATVTTVWNCTPYYYQDGEKTTSGYYSDSKFVGVFPVDNMTAAGGIRYRLLQNFPNERFPKQLMAFFVDAPSSSGNTIKAKALDKDGNILTGCWVIRAVTETVEDGRFPDDPYTQFVSNAVAMNPDGYIECGADGGLRSFVMVEPREGLFSVEIDYKGTVTNHPVKFSPNTYRVSVDKLTVASYFKGVTVDYTLTSSQVGNSPVPLSPPAIIQFVTGRRDGTILQSYGFASLDFRSMSNAVIRTLVNEYVENGVLTVHFDAKRNAYADNGTNKISLNKYTVFYGDFGGLGDAVKVIALTPTPINMGISVEGVVRASEFAPRWCKV